MAVSTLCLVAAAVLHAQMPSGSYGYDGAGNIKSIGSNETYTYDALGRLTSATIGSAQQSFTYDRYGNLTRIATSGNATDIVPGVDENTNRISESGGTYNATAIYDANGRVTSYLGNTFSYDALDSVTDAVVDGYRHIYLYSPTDERIGSVLVVNNAKASAQWTVRDPRGQVLRRFDENAAGTFTWREDYIYRDGQLLAAEVDTNDKTLHFHLDHLGTPRLITGNGGVKISEHAYYPFGQEISSSLSDSEKRKFTGHERDSYVLDYMHARYYAVPWGRFLSVDPVIDFKAAMHSPQSWNRYSYVLNNPVNHTDPTGKCTDAETCIWDVVRWVAPIAARHFGHAVASTIVTGAQEYGMQRLSGFQYATPQVIPGAVLAEAQDKPPDATSDAKPGDEKAGAQDKKLSGAEVDAMGEHGVDAHDLKQEVTGDKKVSKYDLYKDKDGNIYVKPKNGKGRGEPTGLNINDFTRDWQKEQQ